MDTRELYQTKYLKKEDFSDPKRVTVSRVVKENVALPNQPKKERGVIYFQEHEKGMVLNKTNILRAEKAFGSTKTEDWIGKQIIVYVDEYVEFGGETVGGLRLRGEQPANAKPKGKFDDLEDMPF